MVAVTSCSAARFLTSNLCTGVKIKYPNNGPLFPDSRHSNIGITLVLALSITDDGTSLLNDLFGSGNFLSVFH